MEDQLKVKSFLREKIEHNETEKRREEVSTLQRFYRLYLNRIEYVEIGSNLTTIFGIKTLTNFVKGK
jgi:hypothetical protein